MFRIKPTAFLMLWTLLPAVHAQQEVELLDVTNLPPKRDRTSGSGGITRAFSTGKPLPTPNIPVQVTLISMNASSYALGDTAIYEIELENITAQPLVLPWSADYDRVKPSDQESPPGYRDATIGLRIATGPGSDQAVIANEGIYGSDLVATSLKTLSAGQRVRIRASGTFYIPGATAAQQVRSQIPIDVDLRAYYRLKDSPTAGELQPAISSNSLRVRLTK